jgi:hypothetical protein
MNMYQCGKMSSTCIITCTSNMKIYMNWDKYIYLYMSTVSTDKSS